MSGHGQKYLAIIGKITTFYPENSPVWGVTDERAEPHAAQLMGQAGATHSPLRRGWTTATGINKTPGKTRPSSGSQSQDPAGGSALTGPQNTGAESGEHSSSPRKPPPTDAPASALLPSPAALGTCSAFSSLQLLKSIEISKLSPH